MAMLLLAACAWQLVATATAAVVPVKPHLVFVLVDGGAPSKNNCPLSSVNASESLAVA